jgi:hypothetical protein
MSLSIAIALLVCIVGAILNLIPNRASTLGGYAFLVGLWWVLYSCARHVWHVAP